MFSIRKSSTELKEASEALSPEAHAEWGLYKILEYMGLHAILPPGAGQNRVRLQKDIEEYHIAYAIDFDDTDIEKFIARRPDGLAFDKEKKLGILLGYTRAMDTNEDWAEKKEQEKNERYSSHLGFINHLSQKNKNTREAIRNRMVQKTLSMSNMILKFSFIALNSKSDSTLQILPTEIINKNMERFNLHLQPPRS